MLRPLVYISVLLALAATLSPRTLQALCISFPAATTAADGTSTIEGNATTNTNGPLPHGEGARRMGRELRAIFNAYDWKSDPNKPGQRSTYLQVLLTRQLPVNDEITVRMELANEQLRAGFSERAVETMEILVERIQPRIQEIPVQSQFEIHQLLALSYLRMGEQQNCVGMHNALSCNYPLRGRRSA